jgi:hypothetical protein
MWGRRKKQSRLEKQLSLAALEDAMARAEQAGKPEPEAAAPDEPAAYQGPVPPPAAPAEPAGLQAGDVPADNSSGPSGTDAVPPQQRQRPAARREESTPHGSLG